MPSISIVHVKADGHVEETTWDLLENGDPKVWDSVKEQAQNAFERMIALSLRSGRVEYPTLRNWTG